MPIKSLQSNGGVWSTRYTQLLHFFVWVDNFCSKSRFQRWWLNTHYKDSSFLKSEYGFDPHLPPSKPKNPTLSLIQNKIRKSLIQKLQLAQINWKYEASNFVLQNRVMVSFSGQLIMIVIQKFQERSIYKDLKQAPS